MKETPDWTAVFYNDLTWVTAARASQIYSRDFGGWRQDLIRVKIVSVSLEEWTGTGGNAWRD